MKKWHKLTLFAMAQVILLACIGSALVANLFADIAIHNPVSGRTKEQRPAALLDEPRLTDLADIALTTSDGVRLAASYFPSQNRATIILLHGYKANRSTMLPIAIMLIRHGYGVIIPDFRGHGESEGQLITFGHDEVRDVEAAFQYLLTRSEVDPERIGLLGNSMGSATALLYAAENPAIKAVVAQSPYATLKDMVQANVRRLNLPTFPLAPMMLFFIERKFGFPANTVAPIRHIAQISPRPVLILMGGKDTWVNPGGGQQLYAAAGEPRELWFDPEMGHLEFHEKRAAEFEERVVAFFDRYLPGKQ
jgi:alpha-beta hydrolase superfamily lysophospholipase